jgi:cell division protein FtsQ
MKSVGKTRILSAAALFLLIAGSTYLLGWSPIFSVNRIVITGAPTLDSKERISQVIELSQGSKMARIQPRSLENRLLRFQWIKSVEISRHWFSGEVRLNITPRTPIAIYNSTPEKTEWIDQSGEIFSLPGGEEGELPRVQSESIESGLSAIDLFTAMPGEFRSGINLITAVRGDRFLINVQRAGRDIRLVWGDNKDMALKIEVFEALLTLPENKSISMVDLSAPHAPLVK